MKRLLGRLLLTVLLTFSLAGFLGGAAVWGLMDSADVCEQVIQEEGLAKRVHAQLEKDFSAAYQTTAIPAEVYMNSITEDWLATEMQQRTEAAFERINGADLLYESDYSGLKDDITAFFEDYAEKEHYKKDDTYNEKLLERIEAAEKTIEKRMDVFYLDTLHVNGMLNKVSGMLPTVKLCVIGLGIISVVLIVMLVLLEKHGGFQRFYWTAAAMFSAGALVGLPCIYLNMTHAVAAFSVKDPSVYHAVTGLLNQRLNLLTAQSMVLFAGGVVLILLCTVMGRKKPQNQ